MAGSQSDMLARLKAVLPARWFPDTTPVLDGVLAGHASSWAWLHSLHGYAALQTRIASASDVWLDMIANDFFANRLLRASGQTDSSFRAQIQSTLLRDRGTRAALIATLTSLTGRPPQVFEPARTTDTGGWGTPARGGGGMGYGVAGRWGSLNLPYQVFVTAYRPRGSGIANVAGWRAGAGGYGRGAIEYASLSWVQGAVTDANINAAIADVLPVATIAWTRISN